jgi:glycosyltransferase involved in cell wall biosynthesis
MRTTLASTDTGHEPLVTTAHERASAIEVGLLTGGIDKPYVYGLAMALVSKDVAVDLIGSDELDIPEFHATRNLRFLNLRGSQRADASLMTKACRILVYYTRLIRYAGAARPKIFHILWNNRFQTFDRTLLMLYYKLRGKKLVFTAHNVNAAKRDAQDSFLNRLTLRIQYGLSDHLFVHTNKMGNELRDDFGVREQKTTVVPFGINNAVPHTDTLGSKDARRRLGFGDHERTLLFFGRIGPYKGLEYLVSAFEKIADKDRRYRLIIVGQPKAGSQKYVEEILLRIVRNLGSERVILKINFVPDEDTELYFKAADVLVLPYTEVFQSGVLFLGYSFGLPVIASDVGSMREMVVEERTGFLCRPCDPEDLAQTIEMYFSSDLYASLDERRADIREYANATNSWSVVAENTLKVYSSLLQ